MHLCGLECKIHVLHKPQKLSWSAFSYLQFSEVEMAVTDLIALLKITVSDSESSAALDEPNLKHNIVRKTCRHFVINLF